MKSFITIVAASAVLSASLVAGLAATNGASANVTPAEASVRVPASTTPTAWIDPPARSEKTCRDAAWPYRPALCAGTGEAPARKVRVIPASASLVQR